MKKQLAVVLTAAMLSFPVNAGLVLAETTTTPETISVITTETQVTNTTETTAVANSDATTTDTTTTTTANADSTTSDATTTNADTTTTTDTTLNTTTITSDNTSATDTEATPIGEDTTVVNEDGQVVDAGTLPGSPIYWLETLIEKIQVALTFDPVKKAQLIEDQAYEHLAEATELAKEGEENQEEIEKALTSYTTKVEKAQAFLEQVKDPESEESQKLQEALTKVNTNNVIVLGSLLEKLPPHAAQKVALNIVRAMEKAVVKAEKIERKQAQLGLNQPAEDNTHATTETTTTTTDSQAAEGVETATATNTDALIVNTANLSEAAKKSLEEFRVALGLKKVPQGNAYGYYKLSKEKVKKEKGEDDAATVMVPQAVQQQAPQVQQNQLTVQGKQLQQKAEVKKVAPKQEKDDRDDNRDEDKGKKDNGREKEKGNRDRD